MRERPPQLNITQSELKSDVSDYFDNLLAQRDAILASYHLTPETADEFCNLQSTDADREKMLALYENMVYVIEHKEIPPSEALKNLELVRQEQQERINIFFGKDASVEVPPLPETITPERIEQWKQKRFELRYLPPLTLKEDDDYPGWKKKPITQYFNLFNNLERIQNLSENQQNPHLDHLAPNQLAGCWMLVDTRQKPNYENGTQTYEDDDAIQTIITQLVINTIVNREAKDGRRNLIHPSTFNDSSFWEPFYDYLGISTEEANIRLPRVIEQSMFGQGKKWDGTSTYEWSEEYYQASQRLMVGASGCGGVSHVDWCGSAFDDVGFRFLVVFSSP